MTFITGSITSANAPSALYAVLPTPLTEAGFVFVETVITGTSTHQIWKSNAADNEFGLDWYLDCMYITTGLSPGLWLRAFEHYDPATNLGHRGPESYFNDPPDPAGNYAPYGDTGFALDSTWDYSWYSQVATITYYEFSITTDRVIWKLSIGGTGMCRYVGFYQPTEEFAVEAGDLMYPLITVELSSVSQGLVNGASITRLPLVNSDPSMFEDFGFTVGIPLGSYRTTALGWPQPSAPAEFGCSLAWDIEISVRYGPVIGRLLDMKMSLGNSVASPAVAFGDTATITENADLSGGEVYRATTYSNYYSCYFFRGI